MEVSLVTNFAVCNIGTGNFQLTKLNIHYQRFLITRQNKYNLKNCILLAQVADSIKAIDKHE